MNNLKAMMKQPILGGKPAMSGLLKKKPFAASTVVKPPLNLFKKLTGK
jgi:hypothetical protein